MGRHVMAFMAAIFLVLATSAIRVLMVRVYDYEPGWYAFLRLAMLLLVPLVIAQRRWILHLVQRDSDRGNDPRP